MDLPWKPGSREDHVPARDLRASDADRERFVELLGEAHGDGRLSTEEHAERVESAYSARTLGELSMLTQDLGPAEQQPIQIDSRPVNAVFGTARRGGRWVVPARLSVSALFGTVEIDLRDALFQSRHIVIDARMAASSLRLLVPDGVRVEFTGHSMMGSRDIRVRPGPNSPKASNAPNWPNSPDAPLVEVAGTLFLGSVSARAPKRRWRDRLSGR